MERLGFQRCFKEWAARVETHAASASGSSTSYLVLSPPIIPFTVAKIHPVSAVMTSFPSSTLSLGGGGLKATFRPG